MDRYGRLSMESQAGSIAEIPRAAGAGPVRLAGSRIGTTPDWIRPAPGAVGRVVVATADAEDRQGIAFELDRVDPGTLCRGRRTGGLHCVGVAPSPQTDMGGVSAGDADVYGVHGLAGQSLHAGRWRTSSGCVPGCGRQGPD